MTCLQCSAPISVRKRVKLCKKCYNCAYQRKWSAANPDKKKAFDRNWRQKNVTKIKESNRNRRVNNPERVKQDKRKNRSKWEHARFERFWEKQEGKCALCEIALLKTGIASISVVADHDHTTNKPRALLCNRCNIALGHYETRIRDRLALFEEYLTKDHG